MVRISDARMSGTAYGTIVLHMTPEAALGGPLALVRTGDLIKLSVACRATCRATRRVGCRLVAGRSLLLAGPVSGAPRGST